jgi:hypothetical protein
MGPTAYSMLSYHVAMAQILYFAFKPFSYGLVHSYIVSVLFANLQLKQYGTNTEFFFGGNFLLHERLNGLKWARIVCTPIFL